MIAGSSSPIEVPSRYAEVDAPARARLGVAVVGDQRIGHQRQRLVEQEQGQQVGGEGDAHRRRQREREADVEAGLVRLVVGAHVADRIDRVDDPQPRGDQREQHARAARPRRRAPGRAASRAATAAAARRRSTPGSSERRSANSSAAVASVTALAQIRASGRRATMQRGARPTRQRERGDAVSCAGRHRDRSEQQQSRRAAPRSTREARCRSRTRRTPPTSSQAGSSIDERRLARALRRLGVRRRGSRPPRRTARHRRPRCSEDATISERASHQLARLAARPAPDTTC